MITQLRLWRETERRLRAKERLPYREALAVFNALYREAETLGVFKRLKPLEGLETDIRLADALNRIALTS